MTDKRRHVPKKPAGALIWHAEDGMEWEVHASGIQRTTDHLDRTFVVVHVRIRGQAGVNVFWRPDLGAWARDKADSLDDLPGDFCDELEGLMERMARQ